MNIFITSHGLFLSFFSAISFLKAQVGVKEMRSGKAASSGIGRSPTSPARTPVHPALPASFGRPPRCRATAARPRAGIGCMAWLPARPAAPGSRIWEPPVQKAGVGSVPRSVERGQPVIATCH